MSMELSAGERACISRNPHWLKVILPVMSPRVFRLTPLFFQALLLCLTSDGQLTLSQGSANWSSALQSCRLEGKQLAVLDTDNKIHEARNLAGGMKAWIGLRYGGDQRGILLWSDGSDAQSIKNKCVGSFANNKSCYHLHSGGGKPFKDEHCTEKLRYMCQVVNGSSLPTIGKTLTRNSARIACQNSQTLLDP
ncbi:C-type lectin domain family 10 member A-like [Nematostella vectensis]|uniref:C-type lectin domain family 10 member A-like n=1 Tax=Nematostella vectensis TaxID=45351 RepID=UPI00207748A1|nr:C-type lectin domain family 10 member A-like [Nematostella vectensis]